MVSQIKDFLKDCYQYYLPDIRKSIKEFPSVYNFPDGNPISPVMPVNLVTNSVMLIGAFPSARFERRNGKLIPIANNLSPFAEEAYFDGGEIRDQASRSSLNINYFPQLGLNPKKIWITDLVKVYLFPEKHIKNCKEIAPQTNFVNTHSLFSRIAEASKVWLEKEILLCNPKLLITLGEVPARVIRSDKNTGIKTLLNGSISRLSVAKKDFLIASLAHPEIRRINKTWDEYTQKSIEHLKQEMMAHNIQL